MPLAIGIDLGTTNTVAAVSTKTGAAFAHEAGHKVHPSMVWYPTHGPPLVGHPARERRTTDPENTIFSAKRLIGQNFRNEYVQLAVTALPFRVGEGGNQQPVIYLGERAITIPEVSAEILRHVKDLLEAEFQDTVTDAVITVPANFTDAQRQATQQAGQLAGLNVLRLINEPTAAALAYGYGKNMDQVVAVFDFGGGTFDVSLLRVNNEVFEVLASDGDFFLGGDDIDRAVANYLASELKRTQSIDARPFPGAMTRFTMAAEEIKKHLSTSQLAEGTIDGLVVGNFDEPISLPFRITRDQFNDLAHDYVERTIESCHAIMKSANVHPAEVGDVICVGGSTRIPLVRDRLADLFGKLPAVSINPEEVVALGAAIQAGSLSGHVATPLHRPSPVSDEAVTDARLSAAPPVPPLLLDVTPEALSISTTAGWADPLLDKNVPIPIERTKVFTTAQPNQTKVVIECCRGQSRRFAENELLGTLILDDLPPRPRGDVKIEVTFRVDANGILRVQAKDQGTGKEHHVELNVIGAPDSVA